MTDDTILSHAEALAQCADLAALLREQGCRMLDMQDRIAVLEAELAMTRGTLAAPTPDEPATYTHDVPPNAPR